MEATELLEPSKLFKGTVKPAHRQNVEEYYDNLVKESGLDIELNRTTNKNIRIKNGKIADSQKTLGKKKALKGFLTFLIVVLFIAAVISIALLFNPDNRDRIYINILVAVGCVGLAILFIVLIKKKIKPAIKNIDELIKKLTDERDQLVREAIAQMAPLNSMFDWNIPATLFSKTIPLIKLDKNFDEVKYQMLHEKYNFNGNPEKNISTVFVQSGSILGNPFLVEKNYVQEMHDVTYTGHLTISWTTTYTDGSGHRHTQTHTQTLTATVHKPAPYYYYDTWLVYGNDAAEHLSFSRSPSKANSMSEKQLQKFVSSYDSKLDKLTQKSIKNGTNFQRLGNNEFEALFNALDRDNNIEFRLLFTPLAQKNMINLITSKEPYGDDFYFVKKKNLNYIKSAHSQNTNFEGSPDIFATFYDHDQSREFFIDFNETYMQSLYYDLAPIMSIPLYQQHAAQEYIYKGVLSRNISQMETEVMANSYNSSEFAPDEAVTDVILKSELVQKQGKADLNKIHAYSFTSVKHVDFVPTLGGDGHMHNVPVEWYEYIPVSKTSQIIVQKCETSNKNYRSNYTNASFTNFVSQFTKKGAIVFKRGVISFEPNDTSLGYDGNELDNIFKGVK
ncbi:MAG: hypothetical protein MJZ37_07180 [Bacilli bacterium]|nr:hypothetical protein [Bacilli bacterium]